MSSEESARLPRSKSGGLEYKQFLPGWTPKAGLSLWKIAWLIPRSLLLLDENEKSEIPGTQFFHGNVFGIGDSEFEPGANMVLSALSLDPEPVNGAGIRVPFPEIPMSSDSLPDCWLAFLVSNGTTLQIKGVPAIITVGSSRRGYNWWSFRFSELLYQHENSCFELSANSGLSSIGSWITKISVDDDPVRSSTRVVLTSVEKPRTVYGRVGRTS